MCGLVCVVTKYTNGFTQKQKEIFSTLLFIDTLRGNDSTGAFLVDNQGSLRLSKEASTAQDFMGHSDYDNLMREAILKGSALVGHNRKATKGTINDANAHPFLVDDKICLVHNGTLWGDHKQHANVDVDSHAIAHLIAKGSASEAINSINGAFALIWHDFEANTLNFLRNNERPLYWVETPNEWIWASEASMIEFACARSDITLQEKPKLLKEHTLCTYTFDLDKKSWSIENTEIIIKSKGTKTYNSPNWEYDSMACGYDEGWGSQKYGNSNRYWPYGQPQKDYSRNGYVGKDICSKRASLLIDGVGDTAVTRIELDDCISQAQLVDTDEFRDIINRYPYGTTITAYSYAATCVNETDDSDGMFLWLTAKEDPAVLLRYRYKPQEVTKDYLEEIAKVGLYYNCTIDHKAWQRASNFWKAGKQLGFCLFTLSELEVVEKPTIENMEKKESVIVH